MRTNTATWTLALILSCTAPLHLAAKECVVITAPWVVHTDGTTEEAMMSGADSGLGTIVLAPGETVSLHFTSNSIGECGQTGRYKVWKDGVLLVDVPQIGDYAATLTEAGFYYPEAANDAQLFTAFTTPFNITFGAPPVVMLSAKVWLDGPYDASTGLMNDGLRTSGVLPLTPGPFIHISTTADVLAVTGPNAIVDWVQVVLQTSVGTPLQVGTRWALVQRDGDIVSTDGVSPLSFTVFPGGYRVILRHRNHLGVMTADPVAMTATPTVVDFRSPALVTYGTDARRTVGTQCFLWAGKVGNDRSVSYTGVGNDRDPLLVRIGGVTPTATTSGYYAEDVNLDGVVKYTGQNNDRDKLLITIGGTTPTAVRNQQLPGNAE